MNLIKGHLIVWNLSGDVSITFQGKSGVFSTEVEEPMSLIMKKNQRKNVEEKKQKKK